MTYLSDARNRLGGALDWQWNALGAPSFAADSVGL